MPIYFIRHGQSEFNAAYTRGGPDPMIFDPRLTAQGRRQAEDIRAKVSDLGIQHVISSPLTRAVQTSLLAFEGIAPITIAIGHHERLEHSGDIGRSPQDLAQEFPSLSFSHLPDPWWHQGQENSDGVAVEPEDVFFQRMAGFRKSIDQIAKRPMAFVGHGNAFKVLIGRLMENCEIHQFTTETS